jgi:outer membrane protein assembly factor BamB
VSRSRLQSQGSILIVDRAGAWQINNMNAKPGDLVFVGIKGSVVALDRSSGQQVWVTPLKGSDFVNVVVQNGVILASCHGEVYCLDPLTGNGLWHNPLKGFGVGLATIATEGNVENGNAALMAEKRRLDETGVVATSVAVVAASG